MQIKILTKEEKNEQLNYITNLIDYLTLLKNELPPDENHVSFGVKRKYERSTALRDNYNTGTNQTGIIIPGSLSKSNLKHILMALSYIEQNTDKDQDLFSNLEEALDSLKNRNTIGEEVSSLTVDLLPSEAERIGDLMRQIDEASNCYASLTDEESSTIESILERCCLPKSEILQFPASEKTWIENLKKLAINEIYNYASTPLETRDLNRFKQDFSIKIDKMISQIEKNNTLTLKLQVLVHDLCKLLHLRPRFERSREILSAQNEMKQKLQLQKEELKGTPVQSEIHRLDLSK